MNAPQLSKSHAGRDPGTSSHANDITVDGVGLTFSNGFVGLKETSLHINGGEFCTLLGPSGSGKTTLLRSIAGLLEPTSGRILIGNQDVTNVSVQKRNIGFVFQNYALFPHMSVAENIEYPLRLHKWSPEDRRLRVKEILDLVELPRADARAVGELSGGQQQRVAIGRALAYKPQLLLLDEPMGALDRRLRQQLGSDLREIQQRTGITAVYVTHDQEEAFILSDKIAIMAVGEILQYSTPSDLYFKPQSRHVAEFLGEANLISVSDFELLDAAHATARTPFGTFTVGYTQPSGNTNVLPVIVVRPEEIRLLTNPKTEANEVPAIMVRIDKELFLGSRCLVTVSNADGNSLLVECQKSRVPPLGTDTWITWNSSATVLVDH